MANEEWMTIEETARYLQLGKTALYDLAREGTVPSSKVGSKWLFSKRDLDAWVRSNIPLEQFFLKTAAHIEENLQLREPQVEAYKALYEYFSSGGKTAVIQIPVGCGKSGIAAIAPFGIAKGRDEQAEVLLAQTQRPHGRGNDRGAIRDHPGYGESVGLREVAFRSVERAPAQHES
jgi:excisionase family DNA binding protein